MPLGKYYHWCPNCGRKGIRHIGELKKLKGKNFRCDECKKKFTKEEIK